MFNFYLKGEKFNCIKSIGPFILVRYLKYKIIKSPFLGYNEI